MKTLANRIVVVMAGAIVWGSVAYGQTEMKANIPFAFRTAISSLPAGAYTVARPSTVGGTPIVTLRNQESGKTVFVPGGINDTWKPGKPSLMFRCTDDSGCVLAGMKTLDRAITYNVHYKSSRDRERALVTVALRAVNVD
jgi:hypothetical protein